MQLKANDTLHVSSVKADNIAPGEVFEVADDTGRQLVEKGLATEVKAQKAEKAEPAHENKMEPAPQNKLISGASMRKAK
jgi:hypothetical protein